MFRILSWYFGAYTCISDFIHVLQNLYMYFRSYMYTTDFILVLRNLYWSYGTYICVQDLFLSYRSYTCFTDTGVPVGTTGLILIRISRRSYRVSYSGLILILQNLCLFFRYESTRRYYQTYTYFTDMRVPLGTTGLILVLPIRGYP